MEHDLVHITIAGEAGSGVICLNGAARHVKVHDKIIIMCYAQLNETEVESHKPSLYL